MPLRHTFRHGRTQLFRESVTTVEEYTDGLISSWTDGPINPLAAQVYTAVATPAK